MICITTFINITSFASENVLRFYNKDSQLYYDTSLYDNETFLNCLNMEFDKQYTNTLTIKNETNNSYKLYLKAIPIEQSKECNQLLEHISITILLNNDVIYQGKANGETKLINAIYLGEFKPNDIQELSAIVSLDNDYSINNGITSEIDWKFYASSNNNELISIEPQTPYKTGDNFNQKIIVISLLSMCYVISNICYVRKNRKV